LPAKRLQQRMMSIAGQARFVDHHPTTAERVDRLPFGTSAEFFRSL
jgi:hypothetical protein